MQERSVRHSEPDWLMENRRELWKRFENTSRPTGQDEEWRYTELDGYKVEEPGEINLVMKAPDEVTALPMAEALDNELVRNHLEESIPDEKFALLAAATWTNGYFIHIPEDTALEEPIVAVHTSDENMFTRSLIVMEEGVEATVCEVFEGNPSLSYNLVEVSSAENGELDMVTVQRFGEDTWDCSYKLADCSRDARVKWSFALLGGRASRTKLDNTFTGRGSSAEAHGVYFAGDNQHFSVLTNSNHKVPDTEADVETKGVLKEESSSLTRGLISIEREAENTNSFLHDSTLHLEGDAESNAVPCLEIENDDVQASHGATTGKIDDEQMFYLRSRGLSREEAERLIVQGFFQPVVERIELDRLREQVEEEINRKIEGGEGASPERQKSSV